MDFQKRVYPLRAALALQAISCEGEPTLARVLQHSIRRLAIPAGQVAVLHQGEFSRCVVGRDGQWQEALAVEHATRFRFASLTKPVVAAVVYRAMATAGITEQSLLADMLVLPATLQDERLKHITLAHLLGHSSGFEETNPSHGMFLHGKKSWCPDGVQERLASVVLVYAPGEKRTYANANYCLLNMVLQQKLGKDWYALAEEFFHISDYGLLPIPAAGYLPDEVHYDFMNAGFYGENYYKHNDLQAGLPVLGLSGSASGLLRFFQEQVLSDAAVAEQLLRWESNGNCRFGARGRCYMKGFSGFKTAQGAKAYVHTGKLYGATALLALTENRDIVVWVGNGNVAAGKDVTSLLETLDNTLHFFQ